MLKAEAALLFIIEKTSYLTSLCNLLTCGCTMFSPSRHPFIKKYLSGLCPVLSAVLVAEAIRSVVRPRSLPSGGSPSGSSWPDTSAFLHQRDAIVSIAHVTRSATGSPSSYDSEFGDYL